MERIERKEVVIGSTRFLVERRQDGTEVEFAVFEVARLLDGLHDEFIEYEGRTFGRIASFFDKAAFPPLSSAVLRRHYYDWQFEIERRIVRRVYPEMDGQPIRLVLVNGAMYDLG